MSSTTRRTSIRSDAISAPEHLRPQAQPAPNPYQAERKHGADELVTAHAGVQAPDLDARVGTSHKHGAHSVSLLALKPLAASRHISDPNLGGCALVSHKRPGLATCAPSAHCAAIGDLLEVLVAA
jgi:hypothetical protein